MLKGKFFETEDSSTVERVDSLSSVAKFPDPDRAKTVSSAISRPVSCVSWGNVGQGEARRFTICLMSFENLSR